jgi:hypothetical protein
MGPVFYGALAILKGWFIRKQESLTHLEEI